VKQAVRGASMSLSYESSVGRRVYRPTQHYINEFADR